MKPRLVYYASVHHAHIDNNTASVISVKKHELDIDMTACRVPLQKFSSSIICFIFIQALYFISQVSKVETVR